MAAPLWFLLPVEEAGSQVLVGKAKGEGCEGASMTPPGSFWRAKILLSEQKSLH